MNSHGEKRDTWTSSTLHKVNIAHASWWDPWNKKMSVIKQDLHSLYERGWTNLHQAPSSQRPSWRNSQDNEEIIRTVKISRSEEQKDALITKAHCEISKRRQVIHKHNQLSKRSFHKVVRYHHPSNDQDTLWAKYGVGQLINSTSKGPESTRTCTLSKMRPASTINASL
jgi:hypothetical protein